MVKLLRRKAKYITLFPDKTSHTQQINVLPYEYLIQQLWCQHQVLNLINGICMAIPSLTII